MKKINKTQAKELIAELVTLSNKRFKQELSGENEEVLDRVIRQYRAKVARCSWKASQHWCKWNEDGPVLMPDYTRIYYRKGSTEIVLQEFPPQIRFLKFRGSLVNRNSSTENLAQAEYDKNYHFSISLPYVVFIFKFVDGVFFDVKCVFCDRPLRRLEEKPFRPFLSNIDSNLSVCLGAGFDRSQLIKNDITQQSVFVLDYFWHSSFSDEWSTHYWASKSYFQKYDPRLGTLQKWQENSADNPLFVVEDVKWLEHSEENFGDMIVKMFEGDKDNSGLHEEIYNSLVDEFMNNLLETFKQNIQSIENKMTDSMIDELADKLLEKLSN